MKQYARYQTLLIPGKLRCDLRITVDDRGSEYSSNKDGNKSTSISLMPIISVGIIRPSELDEAGNRVRAPWNANDNLGMTKFNFPLFIEEIKGIKEDMKIPELYTYHGKRLELNEEIAAKIRRPFVIGSMTVELSAVVITQPDESRVEGVKMKFNNEQSTVLLTINELNSLVYNLDHMDIDSLSMFMYLNYITKPEHPTAFNSNNLVDIQPKEFS